jgi:predicted outer membrane repeat protein
MNMRARLPRTLLIATVTALAFVGGGLAASAPAHGETVGGAPGAPVSVPVGPRPESITKAWDGTFYVSIQGLPDLGRNDGEIRTFDPATGAFSTFVTGLDNPRGLAFTGKYLVVTDTTVVWIIDRTGGKRILADASAFPHPIAFLNDTAAERGGGAVYVTEMGGRTFMRDPNGILWPTDSPQALAIPVASRVYRISLNGKVTDAVTPSRRTLVMNGVIESNQYGHLICGDMFYGNIVDVDLRTNRKTIIGTGFRAADGVAQGRDGTIYIASFDDGMVWKVDRDGENPQILLQDVGRSSTADLFLDEKGKRLLVPDTAHGAIIIVPLG